MRYLIFLVLYFFSIANVLANSYEADDFTIEYDENVPLSVVANLAKRVSENRTIVLNYLNQSEEYTGTPIKERLIVYIS